VNVWTVDDAEEARRLAALGARAVITNVPARIRAALGGGRG
jgi:glycerophosphoryl diester phosphodiesterase